MEQSQGVQLCGIWNDLSPTVQIQCIRSLSYCLQQLTKLEFPMYGSLYTTESSLSGIETFDLDDGFCIGPHCGVKYWDCSADQNRYSHLSKPNRGPWHDLRSFSDGIVDTGLTSIPPIDVDNDKVTPFQGRVQDHVDILTRSREVLGRLAEDERIRKNSLPTLLHPDFHSRNIFVDKTDPSKITGIIDWQSTSIEPAFMYADVIPDFAVAHPASTSPFTETRQDNTELTKSEICAVAFDSCIKGLMPRLRSAQALDEDLVRLFRYAHRTWQDGTAALREELIVLSSRWTELGLSGACSFVPPSGTDLEEHKKQYFLFVTSVNLKNDLIKLLDTDTSGWVTNEAFERTQKNATTVFAQLSRTAAQDPAADLTVEELRQIWPFDTPVLAVCPSHDVGDHQLSWH